MFRQLLAALVLCSTMCGFLNAGFVFNIENNEIDNSDYDDNWFDAYHVDNEVQYADLEDFYDYSEEEFEIEMDYSDGNTVMSFFGVGPRVGIGVNSVVLTGRFPIGGKVEVPLAITESFVIQNPSHGAFGWAAVPQGNLQAELIASAPFGFSFGAEIFAKLKLTLKPTLDLTGFEMIDLKIKGDWNTTPHIAYATDGLNIKLMRPSLSLKAVPEPSFGIVLATCLFAITNRRANRRAATNR